MGLNEVSINDDALHSIVEASSLLFWLLSPQKLAPELSRR